MADRIITIISRRRVRFQRPDTDILQVAASINPSKQVILSEQSRDATYGPWPENNPIYFDTKPGLTPEGNANNSFGNPQAAPEWVKKTSTWQLFAVEAGDVIEVNVPAAVSTTEVQVAAAVKQAEASKGQLEAAAPKPTRKKKIPNAAA